MIWFFKSRWQCYCFDRFMGWSRWQAFKRCLRPGKEVLHYPPGTKFESGKTWWELNGPHTRNGSSR